jgi:protoheme IX farnesyltransferase
LQPLTISSFLGFIRFKVSIAVTFSAYTAALICRGSFSLLDLLPMSGIFFLAAGASALNQYQEKEYDAKMMRTMKRPLPAAAIKPVTSLWIALILVFTGLLFIALGEHWLTLFLGILNIIWYNGIYTWLKRETAFAVVPGALTGAIPVLMGWSAAGCYIFYPLPLFLAFFIFLWQVPHFWLLALLYEEDYRNAGFPTLSNLFSLSQMKNIIFSWLLAASLSSVLMILFGIVNMYLTAVIIIVLNAVLLFLSVFYLFISRISRYRLLFLMVNFFMLLVFCLIIADNIYSNQ